MKRVIDVGAPHREIPKQVNSGRKSVSFPRRDLKISNADISSQPQRSNGGLFMACPQIVNSVQRNSHRQSPHLHDSQPPRANQAE